MVENQQTLFSETDTDGTITFTSETFCAISKYGHEELLGKSHSIVRHSDMPKQLFNMLWSTIKKGEVFRGIIKNKTKDGSHYWVHAIILPIADESGKIVKFMAASHLFLDEKLAEELYEQQIKLYKL